MINLFLKNRICNQKDNLVKIVMITTMLILRNQILLLFRTEFLSDLNIRTETYRELPYAFYKTAE